MEYQQLTLISTLQILQSIVLFFGVATGTCVCVAGVIAGRLTVGDTVLFLALMGQLIAPLNSWASYYRQACFPSPPVVTSMDCFSHMVVLQGKKVCWMLHFVCYVLEKECAVAFS
jgi:ABC-type transport system involved in Fe-S cluster assembly fused permease/ATPase subunit